MTKILILRDSCREVYMVVKGLEVDHYEVVTKGVLTSHATIDAALAGGCGI